MKKTFILVIIGLMINISFSSYSATDESIMIDLTQSNVRQKDHIPVKGKRTPGKIVTCIIDFNTLAIQTSLSDEIISYQLWDEEGESMIATYACDSDMVAFLSTISGAYQFKIATAETTYVGYIEL